MDVMSRLQLSLIPVLNLKKQYIGVISLPDLLHYFAELSALKNPGGIIVLELIENDYSLAHIAQIVEENGAKILSTYITAHKDSTKIELTLKLNVVDLTSIIQTFDRYEYTIVGAHMRKSPYYDGSSSFAAVVPIGVGVKLNLRPKISLNGEFGTRFTTSDRMDGYKSPYSKSNDIYYVVTFGVSYQLVQKMKFRTN